MPDYFELSNKALRAEMRYCAFQARAAKVDPFIQDEQERADRVANYLDCAKTYRNLTSPKPATN